MTLESCGNTLNEFQESEANNIYRKRQTQIQAWTLNEFQALQKTQTQTLTQKQTQPNTGMDIECVKSTAEKNINKYRHGH